MDGGRGYKKDLLMLLEKTMKLSNWVRILIKLGDIFAWVQDNQVPSRTTITKAEVDSRRGYKKDLFM